MAGVLPIYDTPKRFCNTSVTYIGNGVSQWVHFAKLYGSSVATVMICAARTEATVPCSCLVSMTTTNGTGAFGINAKYIQAASVGLNICYVTKNNVTDVYYKVTYDWPCSSMNIFMVRGNVTFYKELLSDKPDGAIDVTIKS